MTSDAPIRRYAKGDAKRREILEAALRVIAERGYRNSSLQEIADAVGLTKAGVLHYFDSREDLLKEVLRERDAADAAHLLPPGGDSLSLLTATVQYNQTVPGLVQLYSRLVVESEAAEHPGHAYIGERYADIVANLADAVRQRQGAGEVRGDIDPEAAARLLVAMSDGLQLQWMHDPGVDMSAAFGTMLSLLATPGS
ncbi:TetR/AcrR family transcriptional regulator [Frondihabitans australicus]|uniref:TetR/AcrR family transcriptional regulator n=1 Tax=Frondihabitans australicus TaxID=386892 RepID=UPI000EB41755|nr:TetR/AcrR family transcriptional regulator [Frondihabitans australicus]